MSIRSARLFTLVALALLGLATVPTRVEAQEFAAVVWKQLEKAYESVSKNGFESRNYLIGKMAEDDDDSWELTFEKGKTYQIIGVCDNDCSDLDIVVSDGDTKVAEDLLDDDAPIVTFTPKVTMTLRVRIAMAACADAPCFFGIGIFEK